MILRKTYRELWPLILIYFASMAIILLPAIALWPDLEAVGKKLGPLLGIITLFDDPDIDYVGRIFNVQQGRLGAAAVV